MKIKRLFLILGVLAMMFVFYNTFIKDEPQTEALTPIKVEDLKEKIQYDYLFEDELSQNVINDLGGQFKLIFDDIDKNGHLTIYQNKKELEMFLGNHVTTAELADEFTSDYFSTNKNYKVTYKSKPSLFNYDKPRTISKVKKGLFLVKQNDLILEFKYVPEINGFRISEITYLK
ncbi:peptide ABC transporter ATP-binding protein [Bacillus cereus]|nr:peptide ABC transporter ATP-binding protein [Bacillus cereus]